MSPLLPVFLAAPAPWLALAAAGGATALLVRGARGLGWVDDPARGAAARKLQAEPVPVVGGVALLAGVVLVLACDPEALPPGALASLAGAFLVGLLDDLLAGGLGPARKLGLQALAVLPWAASVPGLDGWTPLLALLAGVAALNLANTFDNADGALSSLGLVGLLAVGSPLAGAVAGFLPFNLARAPRGCVPRAYLGDSGSHVLGLLLLVTPGAWPVLLLPALDLARLCVVRPLAGHAPWVGDRRHLAHRLQRLGLAPHRVALVLAASAAPALVAPAEGWGPALTTLAFLLLLLVSVPRVRRRDPGTVS